MRIPLIGIPDLNVNCVLLSSSGEIYRPVANIIEDQIWVLICTCKFFSGLVDQGWDFLIQSNQFRLFLQMRIGRFGEAIGVHMDSCKPHLCDCFSILRNQMMPPRRILCNIHDIKHINEHKGFLAGIIQRPICVLLEKGFAGSVNCAVCDRMHAMFRAFFNLVLHGFARDWLTHHVCVEFLICDQMVMPIGPVIVLHHIDMTFIQPFNSTVICVVLREIAQKAVAERPFGVFDNIKSCFQKNTCVTCAYRYRSTVTSKSGIIFSNRNEYITGKISNFLPVD